MSTLLLYGPVRLAALSVIGLDIADGWQFPGHDIVETKPKLQWTGAQLRKVTIRLRFHRDWCDPAAEMTKLAALGSGVVAYPLVRGSGGWIGRFVLASLRQTDKWTLPNGSVLFAEGDAQLSEWAGNLSTGIGPARASAVASPLLRRLA